MDLKSFSQVLLVTMLLVTATATNGDSVRKGLIKCSCQCVFQWPQNKMFDSDLCVKTIETLWAHVMERDLINWRRQVVNKDEFFWFEWKSIPRICLASTLYIRNSLDYLKNFYLCVIIESIQSKDFSLFGGAPFTSQIDNVSLKIVFRFFLHNFNWQSDAITTTPATTTAKFCEERTACKWNVYGKNQNKRVDLMIPNKTCRCSDTMDCAYTEDNLSMGAFVFRCIAKNNGSLIRSWFYALLTSIKFLQNINSIHPSAQHHSLKANYQYESQKVFFFVYIHSTNKDLITK